MQNNGFYTNNTLNLGGRLLSLNTPGVMGILNVTPDSFYDGNKFTDTKSVLLHVKNMVEDGVDLIDVGGYSSRPGAENIS